MNINLLFEFQVELFICSDLQIQNYCGTKQRCRALFYFKHQSHPRLYAVIINCLKKTHTHTFCNKHFIGPDLKINPRLLIL